MPDSLKEFFSSTFFMPHGHCYLWKPGLVWLQVLGNGIIAASYVAISVTLAYLVYRLRDDLPFTKMYLAFGSFIVLCGVTHVFDVYTIWRPVYWLDGFVRAMTAAVSAGTALLLPPLIPHACKLARGAKLARERGLELETAVEDLGTLYQKTKDLERLKSQFFANVSHELRTPLTLIIGHVERLLGGSASSAQTDAAEWRHDLQIVLHNARSLHKQVNDLLDAARLEAGKVEPQYAETDLVELVGLATASFEVVAAEKQIRYSVVTPPTLRGQVDPDKVERIMMNLLSNAFKFTPDGGSIRCQLSERPKRTTETRRLVITVSDSGAGIPEQQRSVVFERFRQLDGSSSRRFGGTGLGLSITREFVELHGGRISIEDAAEGGASFTVELPLEAPSGVEVREASSRTRKRVDETRGRPSAAPVSRRDAPGSGQAEDRPLVLVIEDNEDLNRFICEELAPEFRTANASNGEEGLTKALECRPDVVVTDLMMPEMSGDVFVRSLRARAELNGVPIVLLTAKADDELRVRLLREGAQDYLTKPFAAEELRARIANLVSLKRANEVLLAAKTAAEAANQELEAFSYSVSHDLRSPLRGLDGFSQVLLEEYSSKLDHEGQEYLRRIRAAAQRMGRLIDDLIELARVSRTDLRCEAIDLSKLARSVLLRLEEREPTRKIALSIEEALMAYGDTRLLAIALENLLGNAWKFTSTRKEARIEFGSVLHNGEPAFFVRDNGAGFEMAHATKLFQPFQRLHDDSEFEGTGIGLATVQRVVRRHGGRVWAEAAVDQGATLYFTLGALESSAGVAA